MHCSTLLTATRCLAQTLTLVLDDLGDEDIPHKVILSSGTHQLTYSLDRPADLVYVAIKPDGATHCGGTEGLNLVTAVLADDRMSFQLVAQIVSDSAEVWWRPSHA